MPAKVRKAIGVNRAGDKLMLSYHEKSQTVEIKKAPDMLAMQAEIAKLIPKDLPPFDLNQIRRAKHEGY